MERAAVPAQGVLRTQHATGAVFVHLEPCRVQAERPGERTHRGEQRVPDGPPLVVPPSA